MAGSTTRRSRGLRIGHMAGVPVYIGRGWLLVAVLIVALFGPVVNDLFPDLGAGGYVVAVVFVLLLLVSVLVHEAAHSLVAQACGYQVNRIVADFWGGHTAYDSADSTPGRSALVAVAGPLSNGLLAGVGHLLAQVAPDGIPLLLASVFTLANGFVAVFNLLPGLPLDGGFLVDALVWRLTGSRATGMFVAGWCGRVLVVVLAGFVVLRPMLSSVPVSTTTVLWGAVIGAFLWMGAGDAIRVGRARRALETLRVATVLSPAVAAPIDTPVGALQHQGRAVIVLDTDNTPIGLAAPEDIAQVPPATPLSAVLRMMPRGWVVDAAPEDDVTHLVIAIQSLQIAVVAVRGPDGSMLGLVHSRDV